MKSDAYHDFPVFEPVLQDGGVRFSQPGQSVTVTHGAQDGALENWSLG